MMKKKITNILKYILIGCFLLCFFPVYVFAEEESTPTYTVLDNYACYENNTSSRSFIVAWNNGNGLRAVKIRTSSTRYYLYIFSKYNFKAGSENNSTPLKACPLDGLSDAMTTNQEGVTYYYRQYSQGSNSTWNTLLNTIDVIEMPNEPKSTIMENAFYYTFGEGAVDPEEPVEPINWGLVRDPEYSTRIAGNGYAAKRNIDYLSWNNEVDSNGNDISECTINIKAVLGSWSGTTQEDLLNKTYNDFNIGSYSSIDLGNVSASTGLFSVSWQRIIDEAGWNFDSLYSHFEDNIFLKQGWYYQLQLVDPDGGVHQWQTLYTPLSSSAAASETVINHNSFDTSIYQVYQDLATINNNTSITINIQDTDYTVTNPDDGDEPSGGVDLWDILKQMLNGIFQIVKNIAALPGKFLEMIQQLITPPQQISEEINTNFNNNMQNLNESQPGIMESLNAVEDIQDTLNSSVNSFNGVPECIFTWDDVTMDLSAFNAGTVTFIAAGSFDFAASFMQMINGFGMTYSEYQFYVSAIIYAWILVFIYRHVYDFLAGTKEN